MESDFGLIIEWGWVLIMFFLSNVIRLVSNKMSFVNECYLDVRGICLETCPLEGTSGIRGL